VNDGGKVYEDTLRGDQFSKARGDEIVAADPDAIAMALRRSPPAPNNWPLP
jgi:hypothetical protein